MAVFAIVDKAGAKQGAPQSGSASVTTVHESGERPTGAGDSLKIVSGVLRAFAEATTDYGALLDIVARQLAEVVKDGCVVRLLGEDGWLAPVSIHMPLEARIPDAETIERLRAHMSRPHHVSSQGAAKNVLESGEALIVPRLDLAELRQTAAPEIATAYETIGIHSLLLVPLRVRAESIGLLALVRFEASSPPCCSRSAANRSSRHASLI
jgi:transcriptional regulator with GAF, ATPase, and Fis domain